MNDILGDIDPIKAGPNTIRGYYGESIEDNKVYNSLN